MLYNVIDLNCLVFSVYQRDEWNWLFVDSSNSSLVAVWLCLKTWHISEDCVTYGWTFLLISSGFLVYLLLFLSFIWRFC